MSISTLLSPARLWGVHSAGVVVAAVVVAPAALRLGFGAMGVLACLLLIVSQVLTPRLPVLGPCAFVIAAWTLPRYGAENQALVNTGVLNWLAALALSGWAVWQLQSRARPRFSHWLLWALAAFVGWGALSTGYAALRPSTASFGALHHPSQFLQGAALLIVAAHTLDDQTRSRWLALLLCLLPVVRGALQSGGGLYLDADAAALSVMALPFALLGAASRLHWGVRAVLALVAVDLFRIVLVAQNRGAAVGLACALAVLWLNSRYRLRWLGAAVPLVAMAAFLVPADYVARFSVLWDPAASHGTASLDRSTIEHRLQLWSAGWRIVADHPWLGVGPGRYPEALATYLPHSEGYAAHNTPLNVAAEFGLVGLAAYAVLFLGAIVLLQRLIRAERAGWRHDMARMVQASLAAYLGLGLVISRHDMPVAYLLVGWALALGLASRRESTPAATMQVGPVTANGPARS